MSTPHSGVSSLSGTHFLIRTSTIPMAHVQPPSTLTVKHSSLANKAPPPPLNWSDLHPLRSVVSGAGEQPRKARVAARASAPSSLLLLWVSPPHPCPPPHPSSPSLTAPRLRICCHANQTPPGYQRDASALIWSNRLPPLLGRWRHHRRPCLPLRAPPLSGRPVTADFSNLNPNLVEFARVR